MNSNWIFTKVSDRRTAIIAINNEDIISLTLPYDFSNKNHNIIEDK